MRKFGLQEKTGKGYHDLCDKLSLSNGPLSAWQSEPTTPRSRFRCRKRPGEPGRARGFKSLQHDPELLARLKQFSVGIGNIQDPKENLHLIFLWEKSGEETAMNLGITLRVKGADCSGDRMSSPPEKIVNFIERLDGVVSVRYDPGSQRFAVSYDHKRTDILRILKQIEVAGQKTGQVYWPVDIQPT